MRRSVDFWYFLISLRATVPGLNRWGFLTPVVTGADFLAIFWATSCFLGTFWAVDFLAVCLVLAITNYIDSKIERAYLNPEQSNTNFNKFSLVNFNFASYPLQLRLISMQNLPTSLKYVKIYCHPCFRLFFRSLNFIG